MRETRIEALLKRARIRSVPKEQLAGYTADVRRRLHEPPSTVVRVRTQWPWWSRVLVPVGAAAALVLVVARFTLPTTPPLRLADASLEEEAAILTIVAPEEPVLPEDDATLIEELELLEQAEPPARS